jgi:hypothetical protein
MVKMRVDFDTSGVGATVMRRPRLALLQCAFSGFSLIARVYLTIARMLTFEAEFTRLMTALWHLNKTVTHPDTRREIGSAVTASVPRFDMPRTAEAGRAAEELRRKGYSLLGQCLSPTAVAEVHARLASAPVYDGTVLAYQQELVTKHEFALQHRPTSAFLCNYKFDDIIRCTPLVRLACDPKVVAAVEAYIGCTPTVSAFLMWHSFPGEVDAPSEVFHRDRDCFRFVKLFVYLNDVDADAGPHEFIHTSHSVQGLQSFFQAKGWQVDLPRLFEGNCRHLNPADLKKLLGENVVRTTGPAGFGFLEDTFGLHRGTRPTASARLIFTVTYTGLPLRFANENDRHYEMSRKTTFADAGLVDATDLERYMLRFFLQ